MIRLAVRCRPEQAERVLAELVELAPGGVEEDTGDGYVEYAIYGPPGEIPALPDLEVAAGDGLVEIETTEIPDDWADRWRDFHRPVWIGDRLVVRPSWESEAERVGEAEVEIVVDPGQAFGTGAHATTSLCLGLLLDLADATPERGGAVDLGTGSGVLAIAAALLGWDPVVAVDHEQAAVDAATANFEANGVGGSARAERLNLRQGLPAAAPLWLANITAPVLREVATGLEGVPENRPRVIVASGILRSEADGVESTFAALGYANRESRFSGDWSGLLLVAG